MSKPQEIDNFNLRRDLTKQSSLPLNRNVYISMGHGSACFLQRVFVRCAKEQREQHDIDYQINREWANNTSLPSTSMRRTLQIYTSSISSRVHLRDERQVSVLCLVCKCSSITDMCRCDREGCRACIDFPSLCQCKRAKVIVNCAMMRLTLTKLCWSEEDSPSASRMSLSLPRLDIGRLVHQCLTQVRALPAGDDFYSGANLIILSRITTHRRTRRDGRDQYSIVHSSHRRFVFLKKNSTVTTRNEKVVRKLVDVLRHKCLRVSSTVRDCRRR